MAAALANQNERSWGPPPHPTRIQPPSQSGALCMRKLPSLTNPKSKHKRHLPESPGAGLAHSNASDDASSINRRPNPKGDNNYKEYVSFNVSTYTKPQLHELKERLSSELERIRQLKSRIDASVKVSASAVSHSNHRNIPSGNNRPKRSVLTAAEKLGLLKKCGQLLAKLMKHKHGYIFNTPVDVVALKLHDYHDIIKSPMDLGTVRAKLGRNGYDLPKDFAADVRLTFDNAMRYNPKGHDVYVLAEQFLARFEEWYKPIAERERVSEVEEVEEVEEDPGKEVEASSWERKENQEEGNVPVSAKQAKLPKPRAKDPNKRGMSLEEKHKLGMELQALPPEKMEQVVAIIRKRNGRLRQEGDEIELDIEAVETETLWELDRFITNYKKAVSKMKRQGIAGAAAPSEPAIAFPLPEAKKDEDVDIGDEMPAIAFPPVEIEKDNANGHVSSSSSGSSSSDETSSSSGSDSGSSSASESENVQS